MNMSLNVTGRLIFLIAKTRKITTLAHSLIYSKVPVRKYINTKKHLESCVIKWRRKLHKSSPFYWVWIMLLNQTLFKVYIDIHA